ncbi:MAG: hypothetical protein ACTS2F_21815 [Thainema sp.]
MLRLKHRKIIFLFLIATMAGGSMAAYSASSANFWLKTVEVVIFQQMATAVIFLSCFGWDLLKASKQADNQSEP